MDYVHLNMDHIASVSEYYHRRNSTRAHDVIVDDATIKPKYLNDYQEIAKERDVRSTCLCYTTSRVSDQFDITFLMATYSQVPA